jgi:hypothetical protein
MQALRMIKEISDGVVEIRIPKKFGNRVEIVVMPVGDEEKIEYGNVGSVCEALTGEEVFLAASYLAVIEEDEEEDDLWRKYLK